MPDSAAPSTPLTALRKYGQELGLADSETDQIARAVLKRLRAQGQRVSETLFYAACSRRLQAYAAAKTRRSRMDAAQALSARAWARAADAAEDALEAEGRERVLAALDALPPELRDAFRLVIEKHMTYADAARTLGCSEAETAARVFRAKEILRGRLASLLG